jgi:hypothetical protein
MNAVVSKAKLAAVLGMMGSVHDGEALAAARTAERMRRDAGLSWQELLNANQRVDNQAPTAPVSWRQTVAECLNRRGSLRTWEAGFLESLSGFPKISPKQRNCLEAIANRVLRRTAA